MTVKEILEKYLRENDFDGLCHPLTECGCGLDDLIGPCEGAQADCKPAYAVNLPEYGQWFVVMDRRPTKEEMERLFTEEGEVLEEEVEKMTPEDLYVENDISKSTDREDVPKGSTGPIEVPTVDEEEDFVPNTNCFKCKTNTKKVICDECLEAIHGGSEKEK